MVFNSSSSCSCSGTRNTNACAQVHVVVTVVVITVAVKAYIMIYVQFGITTIYIMVKKHGDSEDKSIRKDYIFTFSLV